MEKKHVLLAEDDFDFGSILKQYLEIHDFKVTWAHDGKEAFSIFNSETEQPFDICVFDVMMPKMDRLYFSRKSSGQQPRNPICILDGKKDEGG